MARFFYWQEEKSPQMKQTGQMNQVQMLEQLKKKLGNEQRRLSGVQALMDARRAVPCPRQGWLHCPLLPGLSVSLSATGGAGGRQLPALIALLSSLPFEPGGG